MLLYYNHVVLQSMQSFHLNVFYMNLWISSCSIHKETDRIISRNKLASPLKFKIVSGNKPSCLRLQCFPHYEGTASSSSSELSYSLPSPARDLAPTSLLELIQPTMPVVGRNTVGSGFSRGALAFSHQLCWIWKGMFPRAVSSKPAALLLQLPPAKCRWAGEQGPWGQQMSAPPATSKGMPDTHAVPRESSVILPWDSCLS